MSINQADIMASPEHSPSLEIRHKTQQSHDSGAYIDWNSDSGSPTRKHSGDLSLSYIGGKVEGEFVTVVSVDGDIMTSLPEPNPGENEGEDAAFVTVLSIGDQEDSGTKVNVSELTSELGSEGSSKLSTSGSDEPKGEDYEEDSEEVLVYRLPGERLGFGLKFEGGTKTHELVRRLFIQSCAPDSPASRARCAWGELGEGDEILEIDGAAVAEMTRLDCVRCLKESQVVIKLRVQHAEKFTEIPLNENDSSTNLPLVVSEIKKSPPSPPPIPPRKAPRRTPALPPKDLVPIGPPSGFTDDSNRTPPTPRFRQPPQPEVYLDLLAQEELAAMNAESESDDTGSSISTVVDRSLSTANSSFSDLRATTPIDLAKVLSPFEQLERELSADADYMAESSSLYDTPSFEDAIDSLPYEDVEEEVVIKSPASETLQPPESFKDTDKEIIKSENIDGNVPILPPKPAPRKDGSPSKFKSGKKRPPPPPPPRQDRPPLPQPGLNDLDVVPRPPEDVVVISEGVVDLVTPTSSREVSPCPDSPPSLPLVAAPALPRPRARQMVPAEMTTPPSSPEIEVTPPWNPDEDGVVDQFLVTPSRDDLLLDQRDDFPRSQGDFAPFHWGVVTSLATIGEDEEEASVENVDITICETPDKPPPREVKVLVASPGDGLVTGECEQDAEPLIEEPEEEIPAVEDADTETLTIQQSEVEPIIEKSMVEESQVEQVIEKSMVEELEVKLTREKSEVKSVMENSVIEEPEVEPVIEKLDLKESEVDPVLREPVIEESEVDSVIEESEVDPVIEESEVDPVIEESEVDPVIEEPEEVMEDISFLVPSRVDHATCKIVNVHDKEVTSEAETVRTSKNLITIQEEEAGVTSQADEESAVTSQADVGSLVTSREASVEVTEVVNEEIYKDEEHKTAEEENILIEIPSCGTTVTSDSKEHVGPVEEEGGHAPPSTHCCEIPPDTPSTAPLEGTWTPDLLCPEMPAQAPHSPPAPVLLCTEEDIPEVVTSVPTCEEHRDIASEKEADAIEVEQNAERSAAIVLPSCRSDVEPCVTSQPELDSTTVEMDGLLSLQHPLPYVSKHQNGGGGSSPHCTVDDITPPPSFSRLPPDGHEFPPNYIEPCPDKLTAILTSNTDQRRSPKWRQDEKSQRSVRDKIALFSTEKSEEMCDVSPVPTSPPPPPPPVLNRFRSSEDISVRHSGLSNLVMERAVSTIDLSPQDCAPTSLTMPAAPTAVQRTYSTLPRKPAAVPVAPVSMGLGRTLSFSGVTPALHTRSQSLVDVAGQRKPTSSISALLEQRRRGISKLRGLVIPERGEVPVGAVVDLPEIRSRDIPLLKPAVRPTSLQESGANNRSVFNNNKNGNSLLPALPTMPKYSPAFKRKTFSLFGSKDQEITTTKINQPIKPIEAYNKSFNQYYSKSGDTNGLSFVSTIPEPKSLESLSSPRSDISFDELQPAVSEDGDSDSAVSSGRSSPPDAQHGEGDEPRRSSLRRTLSSETASSTASTASSTLTSGSDGCGRRVLKAQSVEAVNRKNVLASARHSNGRPVLGSPLIQRRFDDDDDSSGHFEMHASEEAYYSSTTDLENDPKSSSYVVHTILNGSESIGSNEEREIKVAYVDEICELEFMPATETAPPVSPRKLAPEVPVVSPRKAPVEVTQAPMSPPPAVPLRVTELRAKPVTAPEPPSSAPPPLPVEAAPMSPPAAPPRPPPIVAPRGPPPPPPVEEPESPPPSSPPPSSPPPADSVDGPEEKPNKERWTRLERKYENTTTRTSITSPRSSRQEEVKSFRDIAERWQLMSVDAPAPKAPQATPQVTPRSTPEKPGRRSSSVTDIRRAFEKSPAATAAVLAATVPNHARVSSLDSSNSEETSGSPSTPVSALLSSANSLEQLGSISSLASSTSLISQQELQSLLDEAAGLEEGGQGEMLVLVLHRDSVPSSVGITLAGGADYEARDITVHKVLAGSPADRDGRVQKGDRILSINGRSMKNLTHREALTILKAPRPEVVLVLSRGRSDASSEDVAPSNTPRLPPTLQETPEPAAAAPGAAVLVTMTKDGAGLGFSLEGGRDSPLGDRPLTIKKIFTGGAAEKTGKLSAGDQLVAVNGTDVSIMSRIEAWNLMKRLPLGAVTLLVRPRAA